MHRSREDILESVFTNEVRISGKLLQGKTVDPIKLQLSILEVLLDVREQNKSKLIIGNDNPIEKE